MKLPLLAFVLLTLQYSGFSQDIVTVQDLYSTRHHLEFGLYRGFTRPTISKIGGDLEAYKVTGRVYTAGLTYSYNLTSKFAIQAGLRAGAYPIALGIPKTALSSGTEKWSYFFDSDYTPYAELAAGIQFNKPLGRNYELRAMLGGGWKHSGAMFLSSTYHTDKSNSVSGYSLESTNALKRFIVAGTGVCRKLKNHDLLGLNMEYFYSFDDIFRGDYYIAKFSSLYSYGNLRYKGHEFRLGVNYTFTGYQKKLRYEAAIKKGIVSRREIKKYLGKEYYEERMGKNMSVRVYPGAFAVVHKAEHSGRPLTGDIDLSAIGGIEFTRDFHRNYFWEAGASFQQYNAGYQVNYNSIRYSTAWTLFNALQFNGGAGYILRNKHSIPQLYISAGAAMAFNVDGNGKGYLSGGSAKMTDYKTGNVLTVTANDYLYRNVFPLLYLGIRRDVRIKDRLFLSLAIRTHQGLYKIYSNRFDYTTTETGSTVHNTSVFMRGSYTSYTLGLKLDLK